MLHLPIDSVLPNIVEALNRSRSLVLVAPPGSGKTTRVAPAILASQLLAPENPNLLLLQPRRVAARAIAARLAQENHWQPGVQVGYHIRFDRKIGPKTRLRVLTEGILNRQLLDDPLLEGVGAVLLDEFHERSIHTDLAVALLREVRQTVRPDLILIIMSATLDAEPAASYLGDAPIVRVDGRTFPIEITYQPDPQTPLPQRVADAVTPTRESDGDVLVFLPGVDEIRKTHSLLQPWADRNHFQILPLHGSLPADQQNAALRPAAQRKIILATNIAQTSLTIDGVRTVIDAGLARIASYDTDRGLDRLDLARISKASADQRAGRAGRTAPGRCVRLWSEKEQHAMADFETPDIFRIDLSPTVLSLHAWGKNDVRNFAWFQPPPEGAVESAERLLKMLGALDKLGRITAIGRKLAAIPAHPRIARLLVAATEIGATSQGATFAALLSERDMPPADHDSIGSSDLLHRTIAGPIVQARDQFLRIIGKSSKEKTVDENLLLRLPLYAYPDRVCKRRKDNPANAVMVGGSGVKLAAESVVREGEFFLAIDVRHDHRSISRQALVRIASKIEPSWLAEIFPQSIRKERGAEFDSQRGHVVGFSRTWYLDLLLEETQGAAVDPQAAGEILARELQPRAAELFRADAAATTIFDRIALLQQHMPEHPWPNLDDAQLGEILAQSCAGKRSIAEVLSQPLAEMLRLQLIYPLDRLLDQHAPTEIEVPTGNRISLQYAPSQPPVLAVRLQELFGWTQTPRIASGRVSVRLHLLGPNYRPVQITDDLANFWATTYFQVRKDLRARYPKHSWPDDPLSAKPQAKGGRKK